MKRIILLLMLMLFASHAVAQATTQPVDQLIAKPTTVIAQAGCVTADCHANVKQYKVVHGPVNVNACDACHTLADAKEHRFELARDKTQTCTFCHQVDTHDDPFIHGPLKKG